MCVNQTLRKNRKYSMTDKNGGIAPVCHDKRQQYIWTPCKQCFICRRKKAREWRMRLAEDIKENKGAKIVTLTFSTKSLKELGNKIKGVEGYELDNQICKLAVKYFRERWRKKYKRSPRHWLITELGHGETEHVHLHGIIWPDERYKTKKPLIDEIEEIWKYGYVGKGKRDYQTGKLINYVDASTANYFTKYVNKIDAMHPEYRQIILTSAGIGKAFLTSKKAEDNRYQGEKTNQMYQVDNGGILPMPEYFRRKLYTDEQREKLTGWYLDKNIIYLDGKEVRLEIGDIKIQALKRELRIKNKTLGYGDGSKNYERRRYENKKRKELHLKRFWEGKTKSEEKREAEKYWKNPKQYRNETEKFWGELIEEAKDKHAWESYQSAVRPNIKFEEYQEEKNYITDWKLEDNKQEKIINKNKYRFNTIDSRGYIKRRYTYFGESLTDARIYARNILQADEVKFSRMEYEE